MTAASLTHGGERPGTSVLYFARWIERAIPGTDVLLEPVGTGSVTDAAGLCAVTFTTARGELFMGLADSATLTVRAGEKTYSGVRACAAMSRVPLWM